MPVTERSEHKQLHDGNWYYFCSSGCKAKFDIDPAQFAATRRAPVKNVPAVADVSPAAPPRKADTIYTCPMHAQIRQDEPGSCPICGMTLEPLIPELNESDNQELVDFQHRFWWTLPLTVVVTALAMVGHKLNLFEMATQSRVEFTLSFNPAWRCQSGTPGFRFGICGGGAGIQAGRGAVPYVGAGCLSGCADCDGDADWLGAQIRGLCLFNAHAGGWSAALDESLVQHADHFGRAIDGIG